MSLRYALLALLTAQPMTGYDLAKAFHVSVAHVWHAPDSQIYPELRKMAAEELVVADAVARGRASTKTLYTITPDGVAALRSWLATPVEQTKERDPARLRAAYFEWTDEETAAAHLRAHIAHYRQLREQWRQQRDSIRDRSHPIVRTRLEKATPEEGDRLVAFKAFAYEGLIDRADTEIAWAERGLRMLGREPDPAPGED